VRPNPDDPSGRAMMRRVPDVLDCWFESGSMPYAQVHYPFENKQWFEEHFPADFIVEYVSQTRGWFYTMMVLATALFDRPPFQNCICHGVVLDDEGQKLSKRLKNYPDPEQMFETHGADALRWFLISSPILRGLDLNIDREGHGIREVVRLVLIPIWNAYHFFCLYANTDGIRARVRTDQTQVLDRYLLAKTRELVSEVESGLDRYDIPAACGAVTSFVDALNNWYIRRSRDRFWKAELDDDKRDAYDTLYTALVTLTTVASPLLPLVCEAIHRGLTDAESVHLGDWPNAEDFPADAGLVAAMDRAREVCSAALALRRSQNVRVRQPLRALVVAGARVAALEPFAELIRQELNVKDVVLTEDIGSYATFRLQLNARVVGKRLGKKTQETIRDAKAGHWKRIDAEHVEVAGERLGAGEFDVLLEPSPGVVCHPLSSNDAIVSLDLSLDAELVQEGMARDVVRLVQQARREAGLHVSDRIHLELSVRGEWIAAVEHFRAYIAEQTLARELHVSSEGAPSSELFCHSADVGGESITVGVRKLV